MAESKFLLYKEKPLVKCGNFIYYGSMGDDYVIMMQIMGQKKLNDKDVTGKIMVRLMSTDESKNPIERIIKSSEKDGIYPALDIAAVWLQDALKH